MSGEVEVTVDGPNHWDLDRALKRFEREVAKSGVLSQAKARRYHMPRSKLRARRKAVKREKSRKGAEAAQVADSVTVRGTGYAIQRGDGV